MSTASLECCSDELGTELIKLSNWEYDTDSGYSLSYLLRKLPSRTVLRESDGDWIAYVDSFSNNCNQEEHTPEDAAAKLCIELFKTGVLVKSE